MKSLVAISYDISVKIIDEIIAASECVGLDVPINSPDHENFPPVKQLQRIARFLDSIVENNKNTSDKIIINYMTYMAITKIVNDSIITIQEAATEAENKKLFYMTQSLLSIHKNLQNNFLWLCDNRITNFEGPFLVNQVFLLIGNIKSQLLLNVLDGVEEKIQNLKSMIDKNSLDVEIEYIDNLCAFYSLKALLNAKKNQIHEAQVYLKKADSINEILKSRGQPTAGAAIRDTYSILRNNLYKAADFSQALLLTRNELGFLIDENQSLHKIMLGNEINPEYIINESDLKKSDEKIVNAKKFISFCKFQLLKSNVKKVSEMNFSFGKIMESPLPSNILESGKYALKINLCANCDKEFLSLILKNNIISYRIVDSTLFLDGFYSTNLQSLNLVSEEYELHIKNPLTNTSATPTPTSLQSASSSPSSHSELSRIPQFEVEDSSLLSHRNRLTFYSSTQTSRTPFILNEPKLLSKVIRFNNVHQYVSNKPSETNVYKLHGYGIHRQYVYIAPKLIDEILTFEGGKKIFKNLLAMCERGKVVPHGVKAKAFIHFVNPKTKKSSFKLKDATKDYRFFAREETIVTQNNFTYTLNVIDQFKWTHKAKKSIVVPTSHDSAMASSMSSRP